MVIRFYGPFSKIAGKERRLDLEAPITLRALIERLAEAVPGLAPYAEERSDTALAAHVMFIRKGRNLRLSDRLEDGDTLQVVLPSTGG